jgi:hypothetical protein
MGIDGEWIQSCDLPSVVETRAYHSRGEFDLDEDDLFSSDGGSEHEVASTDEDDDVDDLIENLPAEDMVEASGSNWVEDEGMHSIL